MLLLRVLTQFLQAPLLLANNLGDTRHFMFQRKAPSQIMTSRSCFCQSLAIEKRSLLAKEALKVFHWRFKTAVTAVFADRSLGRLEAWHGCLGLLGQTIWQAICTVIANLYNDCKSDWQWSLAITNICATLE